MEDSKVPSLVDLLANPPTNTPSSGCGVCKWINSLPEDEQTAVKNALANPGWETRRLAAVFRARGLPLGENRVGDHRRGGH